eukprot:s1014_g7.t1
MAVDEVDELVQEMSQHPASKSLPGGHETASLRDLSDTPAIKQACNKSLGDAIGFTECAGRGTYGRETTCAEHPDWKGVTFCCIVGKSKTLLKESSAQERMTMFAPYNKWNPWLAPECCSGYSKNEEIFMKTSKWDTGTHVPARICLEDGNDEKRDRSGCAERFQRCKEQRHLAENQEFSSKLLFKIERLVPQVLKDFEAMVHENEVLRQKLQANKISLDDLPDFKPEKFSLPGVTESMPTYSSELTISGQNWHGRTGRRKSALGSLPKKRKSSLGNEEELVEGVNGLLAVRPTTPQSRDMAEITEEELEKRQRKDRQKKDMEKIKNWSARNRAITRSKSQDQLSTIASSTALGELTLDQQVEQEGKVFGSPEALKDEVRRALHKEDFSLNKYYKTSGWIQAVARSYIFEIFTLILIGANCLWMSIDADLNKATLLPNADPIFQVAENLFCFGFTFELGIRFFALKRKKKCLKDPWFIFDALLVILMIIEVWGVYLVMLLNGESVSVFQNATILRILRVLRLLRTARMAKILRTMPELMLLIKGRGEISPGNALNSWVMPGPWVQSSLDPGWLASQVYSPGSVVEFVTYDDRAKARGRVLATVLSTRGRGSLGTWLGIKVRCVETTELLQWFGRGAGGAQKGLFELHLCRGQTAECSLVAKGNLAELHTDTMRLIEPNDLENKIGDWWGNKPAAADFESFRRQVLTSHDVTATAGAESFPSAGMAKEAASGDGEQSPDRRRKRSPASEAGHVARHQRRRKDEAPSHRARHESDQKDRSDHRRGHSRERPAKTRDDSDSGRPRHQRAKEDEEMGNRRTSRTKRLTSPSRSGSRGKRLSGRRRDDRGSGSYEEPPRPMSSRPHGPAQPRRSRSYHRPRSLERSPLVRRRPRPRVDLVGQDDVHGTASSEHGSPSGVRLTAAADDWVGRLLEGLGGSDEDHEAVNPSSEQSGRGRQTWAVWRSQARAILSQSCSYGSVGGRLQELMLSMDGPMGDFMRLFCSTQPLPAVWPRVSRRGDVLPIHPEAITTALEGVTLENLQWVRTTMMVLNFLYCRGRRKPTGVPVSLSLGENQRLAIRNLVRRSSECLVNSHRVPSLEALTRMLEDEGADEFGAPVRVLDELDSEKTMRNRPRRCPL